MTPPPVALLDTYPADDAAALVGITAADLDARFPVRFAEVGPKFVLIGVTSLDTLRKARLDASLHRRCLEAGLGVQCVFVFSPEAYGSDAHYAARMFFDSGGVREDPATGSANTAFAAYLKDLQGAQSMVVVDQGVEIQRPSRLYLDVAEPIRVGGKVHAVLHGSLANLPG